MTQTPIYFDRHPDDDFVDEVRIIVRERYKTSGMSGDEWRFSHVMQLFRKGALMHERYFGGTMREAVSFVPLAMVEWMESGNAGEFHRDDLCFQPGCEERAISEYEIIERFGPQGQRLHPEESDSRYGSHRRRFCARHVRRGDCGREDADENYRVVSGPGPNEANMTGARISESARMDITVDSLADLPNAVRAARAGLSEDPTHAE